MKKAAEQMMQARLKSITQPVSMSPINVAAGIKLLIYGVLISSLISSLISLVVYVIRYISAFFRINHFSIDVNTFTLVSLLFYWLG